MRRVATRSWRACSSSSLSSFAKARRKRRAFSLLEEPFAGDELARHIVGMSASRGNAGRCVRLMQQYADLCTLERSHRVSGVGRRNAVERVPRFGKAARGQVKDAKLEVL